MKKLKLSRFFKKISVVFLALTMVMSLIQWSAFNRVNAAETAVANITFKSQIVEKVGDTSSTIKNIESGRSFFLALGYNVNSGGDNVNYKSCLINIQLPQSIQFEELVIPDGSGSVFNKAEIKQIAGHDMLRVSSSDTLEPGNAGTIYLKMHFKNMETPDGTTAIFDNMEMTGSEQSGNNSTDLVPVIIPSTRITSSAHQEWTISKSIEKQDNQDTSVVEINHKKYYKVNYQITIRPGEEDVDANRYGRLNCSPFILSDILPTGYPTGGEAQVSEIKVGNKILQEGVDYVFKYDETDKTKLKEIQLNYVNTYKGSDSQSFIPTGAAINTTYSMTVLYDYNAYKIHQNEEFIQKTLTNAATLTYQPLGEDKKTVNSSVPVLLGWQEENGAHTNFKVIKKATVKTTGTPSIHEEETKLFDKTMQDIYYRSVSDAIQFGLYTDENCKTLANDMNGKPIYPKTINDNGEVLFQDVLYGTYYLKEISGPKLFTQNQVKKIVIDANDASITVDDQKMSDTNIDFINTTDENGYGYVAFWKRGSSATSKDTGWLSGVQFTLTSSQNSKETYTATSDKNGIVLFEGIPAGQYTVKENVTADGEFEVSDKTWKVTVKGNQVNYPEKMDVYKENNVEYPYVQNVSNKGKLKFIKSSLDDKLLKGAQFEIFVPEDLNKTYTEEELKNFETNNLVSYVLDSKDQTFVESPALVPGTYLYREIKAPEGYTLDSQLKSVVVVKNTLVEVNVKNVPQGSLEVKKYGILSVDLPFSIPLAGAEFQLYTTNNSTDDQYLVKDSDGNPIVIKSIVSNGEATSNIVYLDEGTYYLRETKVPDNYIQLTNPIEVKITAGEQNGVSVENTIRQHGLVKIHKTDAKTKAHLKDAVFDIENENGDVVDTVTTNSLGEAESSLLPSGTYTLVEKKAPNGYTILDKEISFTISDNEITIIKDQDIANIPYMKYQFTKVSSLKRLDGNTDIKISGVTFRLYDVDPTTNKDASYREFTSDNNGLVTFDKLIDGQTYYYVESKTDPNYTLDSTVRSFTASIADAKLESDSWVQTGKNIVNVPKGKFTVHKTINDFDSTNQTNLNGVSFYYYPHLTNDANQDKSTAIKNKTYLSLGTTANKGEVQSGLLDAGDYWVEEVKNDKYNEISPQVVTVKPGITINMNAENGLLEINNTYAVGRLKIKKISSLDAAGIDASFYVYKKDGDKTDYSKDEKVWEVRTNGNPVGEKLSTHLFEPGEYVLIEQKIHKGSYVLDKTPHPFTIEAGKTNTYYFDHPIINVPTSSLSLIKYESWNSVGQEEVNFISTGFQFKVYNGIACSPTDNGAILLKGKYYKKGEDTKKTLTSGTQKVSITDMEPGVYIVEEVLTQEQINNGYQKAASQAVELVAGGNAEVIFKNKNSNSKIKVTKVDAANHDVLLNNAVFDIYRLAKSGEKGEEITIGNEKFNVISTQLNYQIKSGTAVVYDKDGKAVTLDGVGFSGFLIPGETYFLKEVKAPNGYIASQIWTKVGPLESGKLSEVTIENFKPIEAIGSKVDGLGNKVSGATFALFSSKESANVVAKLSDSELAAIASDTKLQEQYGILQMTTTGTDGQIKFKSLDTTQTYYVLEIKAPVDSDNHPIYQRDEDVHEVKIKVDGNKYYLIDQKTQNTLSVVNYKYQRIWLKKQLEFAGEKTDLNGVNFEIYKAIPTNNSENAVVTQNGQFYSLGDKVDTLHTGTDTVAGNGGAVSIGLPSGVYIIKELDSLPDKGLIIDNSNRYHVVTLTMINETQVEDNKDLFDNPIINKTRYGSFYLNKVSNINEKKLKATFVLEKQIDSVNWDPYLIDGKTVEIKTDGENIFKFHEKFNILLPVGHYRLVEKEVEAGYTKGNSITFDIQENKITGMNNQSLTYYDKVSDAINHPLVVVNDAQGYVQLKKLGRQIYEFNHTEDKALAGIKFEVYKYKVNNGKLDFSEKVGTAVSQSNSQIYFYNLAGDNVTNTNWLDAGDYVIKETDVGTHTSAGYVADYLGKFTVESNKLTKTVVKINNQGESIGEVGESIINESHYGKFSVKKVDAYNDQKTLAGVEFELYTRSGKSYQKVDNVVMKTDNNGIATSPLLPEGDYYLKEIKTLDGYVLSDEYFGPYQVTRQTVTESLTPITNVMKQSIQIKKIDSETSNEIAELTGTTFELYENKTDSKPLQTVTYQKDVGILFNNLKADTLYYIKETTAPVGYELKSDWIEVKTAKTQEDSTKSVVTIKEVENDLLGSLRIEKVAQWDLPESNSQKLPLSGVEFTLYKNDGHTFVQKGVTDKNGVLKLVGLAQGNYVLKETKTIEGFASHDNLYNVSIVKGQENTIYTGDNAIVNHPTLGKFEFKKTDAKGEALTGASFQLIRVEGLKETVIMDNFTTDNESFFASTMLEPGVYRLEETQAPSGYAKIDSITFKIVERQITRLGNNGQIIDHAQGKITITKYNDVADYLNKGNEVLEGVHFGLYTIDNQLVEEKITDKNGSIVWENIDPGKYYVQEINTKDNPEGYQYSHQKYNVVVKSNESTLINYYPDNTNNGEIINNSTMGKLVIKKQDANNTNLTKELAGAIFGIYRDSQYTDEVAQITIGDDGYGISDLLSADSKGTTYYIKELKAPEGYVLDDSLNQITGEVKVYPIQNEELIKAYANTDKNYIEFENMRYKDLMNFKTDIQKGITTSMKTSVSAENSLSETDYQTTFALRDYANGHNTVPAEYLEVSDTKTTMLYYDASKGQNVVDDKQNGDSWIVNSVNIYRAYNKENINRITAQLYYQSYNNGQLSDWKEVPNGTITDAQNIGTTSYRTVSLSPELKAVHVKVKYTGSITDKFYANGIDINVTFNQRPSAADYHEIRLIENVADVEYGFIVKNNKGEEELQKVTPVSNIVQITFPTLESKMPTVRIGVIPNDPSGNAKTTYKPGDNVQYDITVENVSENNEIFKQPVISFDMPIGMSINDRFDPNQNGRYKLILKNANGNMDTIDLDQLLITYTPVENARVIDNTGSLIETNNPTTKVTFKFRDPNFVLKAGESLKLTLCGTIAANETLTSLWMPTYLNSEQKNIQSAENPYGNSFSVNVPGDISNPLVEDKVLDKVLNSNEIGGNKFANANANITVNENNSLTINKYVKGDYDSKYLDYNQIGSTSPGGAIDYLIEAKNGEESDSAVNKIRIVDVLPFVGDSYVGRDNEGGTLTRRVTELKRDAILKSVDVSQLPVGATYKIYYCVDGNDETSKWEKWLDNDIDGRMSVEKEYELPMLYSSMDDSAWSVDNNYHHWIDATNSNDFDSDLLPYVSAVAVEITCHNENYLQKGQSVQMHISMTAPMYTTSEVDQFRDKLIANSAMVAVGRVGHENVIANSDRTENHEVKVQLTMPTGSIGDYAFYDINRDGLQDENDAPIAGLKVTLHELKSYYKDDKIVQDETLYDTQTDNNGYYHFGDLACNVPIEEENTNSTNPSDFVGNVIYEYYVEFAKPQDQSRYQYQPTIQYANNHMSPETDSNINSELKTETIRLTAKRGNDGLTYVGEDNPTLDAGFSALGALGDYVWFDANRNGMQDENEIGINGVTVHLYETNQDGSILRKVGSQETRNVYGKDGYYLFEELPKGLYIVEFDISQVNPEVGGYSQHYTFTNAYQGDSNFDSNASVKISDTVMRSDVITLPERGYDMSIDAGLVVYSAITGIAFEDRNYSDIQDLDGKTDVYIPGTVVELYAINDEDGTRSAQPIATQKVGEDGRYYFDHLIEGMYQVKFTFPKDFEIINGNIGKDDTIDSDIEYDINEELTSGFTDIITIPQNRLVEHVDGGASRYSSLGDYVWFDANKNGLQDDNSDEYGIENVPVYLQMRSPETNGWEQVAESITNSDGYYRFNHLKSSDYNTGIEYRILFDLPFNSKLTIPKNGDSALDSNALVTYVPGAGYPTDLIHLKYNSVDLTWDAGIITSLGSVGDYVWIDENKNGIQDEVNTGLAGIEVVLEYNESGDVSLEENWTVVGTTTTNDSGYYIFNDLVAGMYRVRFQIDKPYYVTLSHMGKDSTLDSDGVSLFDGNWYYTRPFYLEEEGYDMTWDCGVYLPDTEDDIITFIPGFPITGDQSFIYGYIALACLSAGGLIAATMHQRKKRRKADSQ